MAQPQFDFSRLSPEERLRVVEELWDSLARTPEALPVTPAQRAELDRRLDEMESDGGQGIPWEEVLERIRERRT